MSIKTNEIYPKCSLNAKTKRIHILSWELRHGSCIEGYAKSKGLYIRHLCGDARCYNPDHLNLGTAKENSYDRRRHGKMRGISEETAREIYELKGNMLRKDIAEKFDVSGYVVRNIHEKRTHKFLHKNSMSD